MFDQAHPLASSSPALFMVCVSPSEERCQIVTMRAFEGSCTALCCITVGFILKVPFSVSSWGEGSACRDGPDTAGESVPRDAQTGWASAAPRPPEAGAALSVLLEG